MQSLIKKKININVFQSKKRFGKIFHFVNYLSSKKETIKQGPINPNFNINYIIIIKYYLNFLTS